MISGHPVQLAIVPRHISAQQIAYRGISIPKTALSGYLKLDSGSPVGNSPLKHYKMVAKKVMGLPKMVAGLPDFGFR